MIEAQNIVKTYGSGELEVKVLRDLSFAIKAGEFVAVTGPSGAGKSTLLYQLSLLDEPTSGEVFLNGVKTSALSQVQKTAMRLRELGYVFQDYALLPELNALENVALLMLMQGASGADAYKQAGAALVRVGLEDKMHNLPSQLSGGQQQRVSIARAIAHGPQIVFADEPTANLDSANGHLVMQAFLDLHKKGQTIVMITHEDEYARYAGRVIAMKDGQIVSDEIQKNRP
jgi:putative ABC transport system ATP-binding protein